MKLRFDEYGIESLDKYQVVLVEYKKIQNKESKNYGQETRVILGYFADVAMALQKLYLLLIRRSSAKSVEELTKAFGESMDAIREITKECRGVK